MSLMLKLSAILLLSLNLHAGEAALVKFLQNGIGANPNISNLKITIVDKIAMEEPKGWDAYIVNITAEVSPKGKKETITQRSTYFVNGDVMTQELFDLSTGDRLSESVRPPFKEEYYTKANLIYGSEKAKHKVAIFSDPLCPFCQRYVPEAIKEMKEHPNEIAVYYYHFPLAQLHPAAVTLTKAAIVAEQQGNKDVGLRLYEVKVDPKEEDQQKILDAFNEEMGTKITLKELDSDAVKKQIENDEMIIEAVMVQGTPTVFLDGKLDPRKQGYKTVIGE
jgi:thiol:disulfide interchange protein DsbC